MRVTLRGSPVLIARGKEGVKRTRTMSAPGVHCLRRCCCCTKSEPVPVESNWGLKWPRGSKSCRLLCLVILVELQDSLIKTGFLNQIYDHIKYSNCMSMCSLMISDYVKLNVLQMFLFFANQHQLCHQDIPKSFAVSRTKVLVPPFCASGLCFARTHCNLFPEMDLGTLQSSCKRCQTVVPQVNVLFKQLADQVSLGLGGCIWDSKNTWCFDPEALRKHWILIILFTGKGDVWHCGFQVHNRFSI